MCTNLFLIGNFVFFQRETLLSVRLVQRVIKRNQLTKFRFFALGKRGETKQRMVKVAKPCHQVTSKQKYVIKKGKLNL